MKRTIRIGVIVAIAVLAGIMVAPLASAQTTNQTTAPTVRDKSVRCNVTLSRLNLRIARVEAAEMTQSERYNTLKSRYDALLDTAKETEYDTTALEAAAKAVDDKIVAYVAAAKDYEAALLATKDLSCGDSDGAFADSLLASRQALAKVRSASLEVRKTFREQAIPALKDYATWLKDNTNTQTEAQ